MNRRPSSAAPLPAAALRTLARELLAAGVRAEALRRAAREAKEESKEARKIYKRARKLAKEARKKTKALKRNLSAARAAARQAVLAKKKKAARVRLGQSPRSGVPRVRPARQPRAVRPHPAEAILAAPFESPLPPSADPANPQVGIDATPPPATL